MSVGSMGYEGDAIPGLSSRVRVRWALGSETSAFVVSMGYEDETAALVILQPGGCVVGRCFGH